MTRSDNLKTFVVTKNDAWIPDFNGDSKLRGEGEELMLTDRQAKYLVLSGVIEPKAAKTKRARKPAKSDVAAESDQKP